MATPTCDTWSRCPSGGQHNWQGKVVSWTRPDTYVAALNTIGAERVWENATKTVMYTCPKCGCTRGPETSRLWPEEQRQLGLYGGISSRKRRSSRKARKVRKTRNNRR